MDKQKRENILEMIYKAHLYLKKLESSPRDYGTGDLLYASDIHTLVEVGNAPACNLTELAALLDISKAAVSKFTTKLVKMGYLFKGKRSDNDRDVIFHLTKKGQTAVHGHEVFEAATFGPLYQVESDLSETDYQAITGYFKRLISMVEK